MAKIVVDSEPKSVDDCPFYACDKLYNNGVASVGVIEVGGCKVPSNRYNECTASFTEGSFNCPYLKVNY